jgi:hypothetical protein
MAFRRTAHHRPASLWSNVSEQRIGAVLAAAGTLLALAGAAMYVLPGPGFPILAIGLAALITGFIMIAATRRS